MKGCTGAGRCFELVKGVCNSLPGSRAEMFGESVEWRRRLRKATSGHASRKTEKGREKGVKIKKTVQEIQKKKRSPSRDHYRESIARRR